MRFRSAQSEAPVCKYEREFVSGTPAEIKLYYYYYNKSK